MDFALRRLKGAQAFPCGKEVPGPPRVPGKFQELTLLLVTGIPVGMAVILLCLWSHTLNRVFQKLSQLGVSPRVLGIHAYMRASSVLVLQVFVYRAVHFYISCWYSNFPTSWLKRAHSQRFTMASIRTRLLLIAWVGVALQWVHASSSPWSLAESFYLYHLHCVQDGSHEHCE